MTHEEIKAKLFPCTLEKEAAKWLLEQPGGTLNNWRKLSSVFFAYFYSQGKLYNIRRKIGSFGQRPSECLVDAYRSYRNILSECPEHYYPDYLIVNFFYGGLDSQSIWGPVFLKLGVAGYDATKC